MVMVIILLLSKCSFCQRPTSRRVSPRQRKRPKRLQQSPRAQDAHATQSSEKSVHRDTDAGGGKGGLSSFPPFLILILPFSLVQSPSCADSTFAYLLLVVLFVNFSSPWLTLTQLIWISVVAWHWIHKGGTCSALRFYLIFLLVVPNLGGSHCHSYFWSYQGFPILRSEMCVSDGGVRWERSGTQASFETADNFVCICPGLKIIWGSLSLTLLLASLVFIS